MLRNKEQVEKEFAVVFRRLKVDNQYCDFGCGDDCLADDHPPNELGPAFNAYVDAPGGFDFFGVYHAECFAREMEKRQ